VTTKTPSWDDLRILLAVHREQSFFAAGKALGVAASTVARRIEALERTLGQPIVHRANDGTRIYADALPLVALAETLELGLSKLARGGRAAEVTGTVRVSLPEGLLRPIVPALARLHAKHPELEVEVVSESRVADIARGEADLGIRIVRSSAAAVVSKLVGRAAAGLFASREYVDRRLPGAKLPCGLAGLQDWVGFDSSLDRMPHQQWLRRYGASRFVFRSNSAVAIEAAVLAGIGVALLSEVQGREFGTLVQLDTETAPPHVEIFLAFRRDAKAVPRVRTVLRAIEAELRRQLA